MHPALIPQQLTPEIGDWLHVYIEGRDVKPYLHWPHLSIDDVGESPTDISMQLTGRLVDFPEIAEQARVRVYSAEEDADIGVGYVVLDRPTASPSDVDRIDLRAEGPSGILDSTYIPLERRPAETFRSRVGFLWGKYRGSHLSGDLSQVDDLGNVELDKAVIEDMTLRAALEATIGEANDSAEYYVDAGGRLHVFEPFDEEYVQRVSGLPALPDPDYPIGSEVAYNGRIYENAKTFQVGTPGINSVPTTAEYYNGKTYIAYVNQDAASIVGRVFDHATRAISEEVTLIPDIEDPELIDGHASPSVLVRASDKRVMVFASAHIDKEHFWQWTSRLPEDMSDGTLVDLHPQLQTPNSYTYPRAFQFASGRLMLIVRIVSGFPNHANAEWGYATSDDNGATWTAVTSFWKIAGRGAYIYPSKTSVTRVDIGLADGNSGIDSNVAMYHLYTDGTNFYRSDGTQVVSAKPWGTADATLVYQPTGDEYVAVAATALDAGAPRMVYKTDSPSRLRWAAYSGGTWTSFDVSTTISGGADSPAIDPTDANVVYAGDDTRRMTRYVTTTGGASWSSSVIGSGLRRADGARIPWNAAAELAVMWYAWDDDDVYQLYAWSSDGGGWTPLIDGGMNANMAPYSVNANETGLTLGQVSPSEIDIDFESKEYVNAVYVKGRTAAGTGLYIDHARLVKANGLMRTAVIQDQTCRTAKKRDRLARLYLRRARARIAGRFVVRSPYEGWRTGQTVAVRRDAIGVDAVTTIITKVSRRPFIDAPDARWEYEVDFGSTKPGGVLGVGQ